MNDKIKELLAVLDMPESWQQLEKLIKLGHVDIRYKFVAYKDTNRELADLAFRLRDEIMKKDRPYWLQACKEVHLALVPQVLNCSFLEAERCVLEQHAIGWIIAALRAKKLAKEV